jgi:hypothetical protein
MKYRSITKLRYDIQKMRERKLPWRVICERLAILTTEGKPNTGLAEDIGYKTVLVHGIEQPYTPSDPDVRERLGLAPVCQECHRTLRSSHRHVDNPKPKPDFMQWWKKQDAATKRSWIAMLYRYYGTKGKQS